MKKEYVKPYLAFESFQLVAALAGSCGGSGHIALNQSVDRCTLLEEDGTSLWGDQCEDNVYQDPDLYPELCYNNTTDNGVYLTS